MKVNWRQRTLFDANGRTARGKITYLINKPRNWLFGALIATCLCTIIGPFDSSSLSLPLRFLYWSCWNGFSVLLMMSVLSLLMCTGVRQYYLIAVIASSIFACFYSLALTLIAPRIFDSYDAFYFETFLDSLLISLTIFALVALATRRVSNHPKSPILATKLEKYPNAEILALRAQDHYVEIITSRGNELLRNSFASAVEEMYPCDGMQVHRSYWVARDAIYKIDRRKLTIKLINGAEIPISRRRLREIRDYIAKPLKAHGSVSAMETPHECGIKS